MKFIDEYRLQDKSTKVITILTVIESLLLVGAFIFCILRIITGV